MLSVVDLKRFFDLPDAGLTDLNKVIVLQDKGMEFGILADAIAGIRPLSAADIQTPLPHLTGLRGEFSRGIAPGPLVVLNIERMLRDKTLTLGNGERKNTT
jgi:purine-binding chemotaxis protein CheW